MLHKAVCDVIGLAKQTVHINKHLGIVLKARPSSNDVYIFFVDHFVCYRPLLQRLVTLLFYYRATQIAYSFSNLCMYVCMYVCMSVSICSAKAGSEALRLTPDL